MSPIDRLLEIMARLRDPQGGCPWDVEQSFATIAPYTIEEAYEVDDAIRRGDLDALREELGDLLLQVVFHAQMAREAGHFAFADVAAGLCDKLVRRHPHVFGDAEVRSAGEQLEAWEALCRELGERPADVALAWLLHNPVITAPIIGPRNADQLDGTLRALEIELTDEVVGKLDEIFPGPGGPGPEAWAW